MKWKIKKKMLNGLENQTKPGPFLGRPDFLEPVSWTLIYFRSILVTWLQQVFSETIGLFVGWGIYITRALFPFSLINE